MKWLFLILLKKYSKTEKERFEILKVLDENVKTEYNEQTVYGNVYNFFIEFIMSNNFVVKCTLDKDTKSLEMIKSGINNSYDKAIKFIEKEMK